MAKGAPRYVCQSCGAVHPRWAGRCDSCGEWSTIQAEAPVPTPRALQIDRNAAGGLTVEGLQSTTPSPPRLACRFGEFDRVTGGGLVAGSALLIGGDPGIGKSTLLLQVAADLAGQASVLYATGEESTDQVRLRAQRLGLADQPLALASTTSTDALVTLLDSPQAPALLIVDSIQTLALAQVEAAPGSVGQVRASAQALVAAAKRSGTILVLIGHVTKDGLIAGPRVLEHLVDTVLHLEGERGHAYRILRAVKNRFGATDEIGVFEMTAEGMTEVANPSALFLSDRSQPLPGVAVLAGLEGSRPLLVELQALVAPASFGTPRRQTIGWDPGRLALVLAVLEARAGLSFGQHDVYLSVAGGLRVQEPAADLAAAAALIGARLGTAVPEASILFGEFGLTGEVRAVAQAGARLREAARLGFVRAIGPSRSLSQAEAGLSLTGIGHVRDLVALLAPESALAPRQGRVAPLAAPAYDDAF